MSNSLFSIAGDRLHMLLHHGDPDDGGDLDSGLDPGRGLAGRPLHAGFNFFDKILSIIYIPLRAVH